VKTTVTNRAQERGLLKTGETVKNPQVVNININDSISIFGDF
jgi:hypothetical protein